MLISTNHKRAALKALAPAGVLAVSALLVLFSGGQAAHAATITVNGVADVIADDGVCTLREAITAANTDTASGATPGECPAGSGADTIDLSTGTYTLSIAGTAEDANATGDLDVVADLTMSGAGATATIVDGGWTGAVSLDRVFHIVAGTVAISGLTIQNGSASEGGGIYNSGTMTLNNSTVSGNTVYMGGGIYNRGMLTLNSSTVSGNRASGPGGGIYNGGTLTVSDSTVSGNSAAANGGGIYNGALASLKNTIVANNATADCAGVLTSAGHNLDSDNTCNLTAPGDLPGVDPMLGPLADNGGPTQTQALLPGSPAIDAGSADCPPPASDQRGFPRPMDGNSDSTLACDIGAYEFQTFTIYAKAGANGSITPSGLITVNEGGSQRFTMTPDPDYHVSDVFVRSWAPSQIVEVPSVVSSYQEGVAYGFSGCTSVFRVTGEFAGASFTKHGVNYVIGLDESRAELGLFTSGVRVGSVTVRFQGWYGTGLSVMPDNADLILLNFNELGCILSGTVFGFISETPSVVRVMEGVVGGSVGAVTTYTFSNVTANHTIDASFAIDTHSLTVTKAGTGTGTVLSLPSTPGINCGSGCATQSAQYNHGTAVGLIALPDEGSTFTGWSAACTGAGTCAVTMDVDRDVTAIFVTPRTYTITATAGANGTIAPSGSLTVEHGASQTFTITPDTGYRVADVLVGTAQTPTLETARIVSSYQEGVAYGFSGCTSAFRVTGEFAGASFTFNEVNYVIGPDPSTGELALFVGGTRVGSVTVRFQGWYGTGLSVMPDNADLILLNFNELGCILSGTVFGFISETFGISGVVFPFIFGIGEETLSSAGAVNSYTFSSVTANHTIHATFEVDPDPDIDDDGYSNDAEAAAGSDPYNPLSTPEICDRADNDLDGLVDDGFPSSIPAFRQPVNDPAPNSDAMSVFKLGSTVPLKFKLYHCDGTLYSDDEAQALASAGKAVLKVTAGTVDPVLVVDEAVTSTQPDQGNRFRYDPVTDQFIYNWGTKGYRGGGQVYTVVAQVTDPGSNIVKHGVNVALK